MKEKNRETERRRETKDSKIWRFRSMSVKILGFPLSARLICFRNYFSVSVDVYFRSLLSPLRFPAALKPSRRVTSQVIVNTTKEARIS